MNRAASIPFQDVGHVRPRSMAAQRWATVAGGGALAVFGLTRRSAAGAVMAATGGALAFLAVRSSGATQEPIARSSIQLNCSPEEAFRFWRDFEHFPLFMNHLESVVTLDDRHSRWAAIGPLGTPLTWVTEIVSERENQAISWRSLPGSDVMVHGSVSFRPATGNRGTVLTAILRYLPPGGRVGAKFAKLLGKNPSFMMRQDLHRLKALIEAGEIPTIEGQSHGPRSAAVAVLRILDPDRPIRRGAHLAEVIRAKRRIS